MVAGRCSVQRAACRCSGIKADKRNKQTKHNNKKHKQSKQNKTKEQRGGVCVCWLLHCSCQWNCNLQGTLCLCTHLTLALLGHLGIAMQLGCCLSLRNLKWHIAYYKGLLITPHHGAQSKWQQVAPRLLLLLLVLDSGVARLCMLMLGESGCYLHVARTIEAPGKGASGNAERSWCM